MPHAPEPKPFLGKIISSEASVPQGPAGRRAGEAEGENGPTEKVRK